MAYDWRGFNARPNQIIPPGDWYIWFLNAGRGFGKTRTGAEAVREMVETKQAGHIALIAETAADARDVMVSAIVKAFPPSDRPNYVPSKRRLDFSNGAVAFTYNAVQPDQLRGPQHDFAWMDEVAKWRYARDTWDQAQFGMREGKDPKIVVTTTPRPIELIRSIVSGGEGNVHVTTGKTTDNISNLPAVFLKRIVEKYEGTRLGRQELNAEILGDMPGALWALTSLDFYRVKETPQLERIVVSVDPAATNTENSDDHGIIVAGVAADNTGYVVEDASMPGTPVEWARKAIEMVHKYYADCIVVEVNMGGDMVANTIRGIWPDANITEVRATKGKHVRAEPIASLYEQGRIRHAGGFKDLENQMSQMTASGYKGPGSPDNLDAMVWAFTELFEDIIKPAISPIDISTIGGGGGGWMGS